MEVAIYSLLPSMLIGALMIFIFFRSIKAGQYNDLESHKERMLHQDERSLSAQIKSKRESSNDIK